MEVKRLWGKYQSPISMLLVQLITTGVFLLSKITLDKGVFIFSLLTYRLIAATISIAPLAYFWERNLAKELSRKASAWLFISGMLGTGMMSLYYYGMRATSATYASNLNNLVPATTFVLSIIIRVEKLELRSKHGRLKLAGAILGFLGAVLMVVYKGNSFHMSKSNKNDHLISTKKRTGSQMMQGSLFLVGSCLSTAAWFIAQVKLSKVYPSLYWTTMLSCLAACIQSAVIGVSIDRRKSSWRLGWNLQLLTILYSAVLSNGANFCLIAQTITTRGPIYPSMFNPLSSIFVTILESLFMGEVIYTGSILGMLLIIGGFYIFLWGKRNESPSSNIGQESDVEDNASTLQLPQSDAAIEEGHEEGKVHE